MIQLGHYSFTHFMNRFPEGTGAFCLSRRSAAGISSQGTPLTLVPSRRFIRAAANPCGDSKRTGTFAKSGNVANEIPVTVR
jgi:hypothetical protein